MFFILILLLCILLWVMSKTKNKNVEILDHWHQHFYNLQLSSKEFYDLVEQQIKDQSLPKVKLSRVTLSEAGLFSSNREYLRIQRDQYTFDICAAPFGKEFFISWWLVENSGSLQLLLTRLPFIGRFFIKQTNRKTYYQIDTETMFMESIHSILLQLIDSITEQKGLRSLSETQRQITKGMPE